MSNKSNIKKRKHRHPEILTNSTPFNKNKFSKKDVIVEFAFHTENMALVFP